MATAKNTQYFVINTVAATAGDLTTPSQGRVMVTGDTEGFLRRDVSSILVNKFIVETLQISAIMATATPAAGTTYRFIMEQEDASGDMQSLPVDYYAQTGVTAAILAATITASVNAYITSGHLKATAAAVTSGNGGVSITALTGYPVIRFKQPIAMTAATALTNRASTGNLSRSASVLTVLEGNTSTFAVGQLVKVSGWTGTAVLNGHTAAEGLIVRVDSITTNTNIKFLLEAFSGTITAAVCNLEIIASNATGIGADLTADRSIASGSYPLVSLVAANVYHEVIVTGGEPSGSTMTVTDFAPFEKHYFVSSTGSASNALLLTDRFTEVEKYFVAGGTTADPILL